MKWLGTAASLWAWDEAPDVPRHLVSTLLAVARHADEDGRGAYPSATRIAELTRGSESQAKRNLAELEKRGLITRGNQRLAIHIRADRRPVVYDLAMSRGSAHDTPSGSHGVAPMHGRGSTHARHGVAPALPEEILNGSGKRGRDNGAGAPRAASPKPRRGTCDPAGPGKHTEACRSGDSARCTWSWCECQCHGRRPAKAAAQ